MYTGSNQKDWDVYLPYVLHAYRTSVHDATRETPYYLVHLRDARMPSLLDSMRVDEEGSQTVEEFKNEMLRKAKEVFDQVRQYSDELRQ
jgi:hypothetical protein